MMRKYNWVFLFMVSPYWMSVAVAAPAASGVAATAQKAPKIPSVPNVRNPATAAPVTSGDTASQRSLYPKTSAASGVAPSPEEDYQAALKADLAGDMVDSGRLYMRAAKRGHAHAQAQVAYGLRYAGEDQEALVWFRKAAEQGNAFGQLGLSTMYAESGVPGIKQDFAEARKWLILAAEQGEVKAIATMANAYINGGLGLDENARNSPEALVWIKRGADINLIPALKALASAYRAGQYGLEADPKQADELDAKVKTLLGQDQKKKSTKIRQ